MALCAVLMNIFSKEHEIYIAVNSSLQQLSRYGYRLDDIDVEDFQKIVEYIQKEVQASKKVVFENAGHLLNLEYPETFISEMRRFLSTIQKIDL